MKDPAQLSSGLQLAWEPAEGAVGAGASACRGQPGDWPHGPWADGPANLCWLQRDTADRQGLWGHSRTVPLISARIGPSCTEGDDWPRTKGPGQLMGGPAPGWGCRGPTPLTKVDPVIDENVKCKTK